MNKSKLKKIEKLVFTILVLIIMCIGLKENSIDVNKENKENIVENNQISYEINNFPEYNGEIYVQINNNIPTFSLEDMNIEEAYYSNLENGKVRNGND